MTTGTLLPEAPRAEALVIEDLTRRELIASAVSIALLAACGGDDDDDSSAAAPVTVEHYGGVSEVPARVERVVTMLGEEDLHGVLALGVVPVLSATWNWESSPFADRIDAVETKLEYPVDLEQVAAAEPDVIIGTDAEEETYEQLSEIAPTILIDRFEGDPSDHLRLLGRALRREDEAEEAIQAYDDRVHEVRELVEAGPLAAMPYGIAFKWVIEGNVKIFGPNSYAGRMLLAVGAQGLVDPGNLDPEVTGEFGENFSTEQLNVLEAAEALFLIAHPEVPARRSPTCRTGGCCRRLSQAPSSRWRANSGTSRPP